MTAKPRMFTFTEDDLAAKDQEDWYRLRRERLQREGLPAEPYEPSDTMLEVYQLPDMEFMPQPNWLIGDFVEQKGLLAFYGKPKTGKTAFLSSMLWAWCAGKDWWFDKRFKLRDPDGGSPRRVLYIILEGQAAYWQRAQAWVEANELDMESLREFYVAEAGLSLFTKDIQREDRTKWPQSLKMLWNRVAQLEPTILVIDTFSRATGGIDENSSQVATVMGILDDMRDEFGLTTIIVHHSPKADKTTLRGHSSMEGAASSLIYTERDDNINTLVLHAFRNAEMHNVKLPFKMTKAGEQFYVEPTTVGPASYVGMSKEQLAVARNMKDPDSARKYIDRQAGLCWKNGRVAVETAEEPEVL